MSDQPSILDQGKKQTGELAFKATTDGNRADGEMSVEAGGSSWAAKFWAKVAVRKTAKPDASVGVDVTKRWFRGR